jgi:hypothetical protein
MTLTITDLENGRDFWLWALEDIDNNTEKDDWPEYDRIAEYRNNCPFCEEHLVEGKKCGNCPLKIKGLECNSRENNPWDMWAEINYPTHESLPRLQEDREKAANQILAVYEEEIAKLKSEG